MPAPCKFIVTIDGRRCSGLWTLKQGGKLLVSCGAWGVEVVDCGPGQRPEAVVAKAAERIVRAYHRDRAAAERQRERAVAKVNRYWTGRSSSQMADRPSALDPRMASIIGRREGGDPADEIEHFYLCKACQQPVDMRDLAAVFHHEEPGHEPLPWEDAERLVHLTAELRRIVARERLSRLALDLSGALRTTLAGARGAGFMDNDTRSRLGRPQTIRRGRTGGTIGPSGSPAPEPQPPPVVAPPPEPFDANAIGNLDLELVAG